jgi:hypothetical protein
VSICVHSWFMIWGSDKVGRTSLDDFVRRSLTYYIADSSLITFTENGS